MQRYQSRIHTHILPNLPPVGDAFSHDKDSGTLRFAFQNINGASVHAGLKLAPEIDTLQEWNIDIMGMSETNCPWSPEQKSIYDYMMNTCFSSSRTVYTSAPAPDHSFSYLPGGNLLTINGHTTGRIQTTGTDEWGRFCWYTLRGCRDEGVLVITAYRVCHEASHNPGPFTAYQQQYMGLRKSGQAHPNPRRQILIDILRLIRTKREEGFRPILMMDANGDYNSGKDPYFASFLLESGLSDPFYDKFGVSPPTYVRGTRRLDYILVDNALVPAIIRIGYLGTHEGVHSDHVMAVLDVDEKTLFAGLLNRPPPHHSREILIEQADKVHAFLQEVTTLFKDNHIQQRTYALVDSFTIDGPSTDNIQKYQTIYDHFLELSNKAAHSVGRKKFGYMRSPELTNAGRLLVAYKMILDCKSRGAPPSPALERLSTALQIDLPRLADLPLPALRALVRERRRNLWEVQKRCEDSRYAWLETVAQDRSRALGNPDWEKCLNAMKRKVRECATNRKLSILTKGRKGSLDRIQIPTGEWYVSLQKGELYHYDKGVFEAYPAAEPGYFHTHHTIKVPPPDAVRVEVSRATKSRWTISLQTDDPIHWMDITRQDELEALLLSRNERHLRQTELEGGISTRPLLTAIRANYGFNDMSSQILQGNTIRLGDLTPEMGAFFQALQHSSSTRSLPQIDASFTSGDVQEMFKRAKERTSSDSTTLNYTLWKCLAQDDMIAGILSVLLSLPFLYGFVNDKWTSMTDFMLEKKPGVRQIHTLRIIGKVAAEFNTVLKYLIGKKARDNFEATNPVEDQHGFRPHRSSVDAAILKVLTFDCARLQKLTMGSIQHDMTAHFDRMYPAMTSIYATRYGVDPNIMLCINKTIESLRRRVETSLGLSSSSYDNAPDKSPLGGMVQGKADVPQWSTQQSDAMLLAHSQMTEGLTIDSPNLHRSISRHNVSFADDTDGQVSRPPDHPHPIPEVVAGLQHSAQTWSNLVQICGGLIALHKCNWTLIAWEVINGRCHMIASTTERLIMEDGHGTYSVIEFLPPDQPNVGLGYRICPNGSQSAHFTATRLALETVCRMGMGAHLSEAETRQLLRQRLLPKMAYALNASSFTKTQCYKLNSTIRGTLVPKLRLNRNTPHEVLFGPLEYGGLELPEMYTLQDQVQLPYLLKQLRWDKSVANDLLVTLDNLQLISGLLDPILEFTSIPLHYIEDGFLQSVRQRLQEMDAGLWVEKAWTPSLQRVGDESLMARFITLPRVTRSQLRQANMVRLYLRIITIADLCDPTGTYVPSGMLNGDWRAGSDLQWPYQPLPPKSYFRTFRRLLQRTFCTNAPLHHHYNDSLNLDRPLGAWFPVPRAVWFPVYRTQHALYWRKKDDNVLYVLERSTTSGFYHFSHTTSDLPLASHPITYQQIGNDLWTQRPYRMTSLAHEESPPAGHLVSNTLTNASTEILTIGCDGSVYLDQQVAACAWVIAEDEKHTVSACFLLTTISSISSYRSELEGIYRS
jgi:hypothetical protein